ncbi:MAG: Serine/threonine protein phosphatase PrpC [Nocardioides sp.]|nr:Serine/threonine protein phosphatase PrpC [Nocardioides sp.]
MTDCPSCHEPLADGAQFCEACGAPVGTADAVPTAAVAGEAVMNEAAPFDATTATRRAGAEAEAAAGPRPCVQCGGTVGPDGYCESCGTKQPSERDHFREQPAPWVAGVCDRGIRHSRNEDAMALVAAGDRAVLVVLDGVSNTDDSHLASLAGARAAREVLAQPLPAGLGTPGGRTALVTRALTDAVQAANTAIVAYTPQGSTKPPSATFSVAVLEGTRLTVANIGDSRVYWLPDGGPAAQLTVDDSVAQQQMEAGMSRKDAEEGPQGHAITRWLGIDAPDLTPRVLETDLTGPGWLANVSDGMWNYVSEAQALADLVAAAGTTEPAALALAMVAHANSCGGQDNITVALARVETGHDPATAPSEGAPTDG